MIGPIQTLPKGLLGLLQLKQTGQNPGALEDLVRTTIELRDMYEASIVQDHISILGANISRTVVSGAQIFGTWTTPGAVVVPQGQIWRVWDYTVQAALLAAEYIRFAPAMIPPGGIATGITMLGPDANDVISARARTISCRVADPFWATAGYILGTTVFDCLTAGSITLNGQFRAAVFPT